MGPVSLLAALLALLAAVTAGTVAHELSHAVVLRALGVPCDVTWFPDDDAGALLRGAATGRWAVVTPGSLPTGVPAWRLRAAAVTPLALALPFVAVLAGAVPDPVASGSLPLQFAVVGWLACALPSPQDFSVLWYADRALPDAAPDAC